MCSVHNSSSLLLLPLHTFLLLFVSCPQAAASFRAHPPALAWGPPPAAVRISALLWSSMESLLPCGLLQGLQGNLHSGTWTTSSPSLFTDLGVCRSVSVTTFPHPSHHHEVICCFLNTFSKRRQLLGCWAQLCPVMGPLELDPALSNMGQPCPLLTAAPVDPHTNSWVLTAGTA